VARLQRRAAANPSRWEDVQVSRYHNCQRRDGTRAHAETFLVADGRLRSSITSLSSGDGGHGAARLVLYMTYQPCHYSGGHTAAQMRGSVMSCSNLLLRFMRDVLSPARVALELVLAYVYRAHWQEGHFPPKYSPAVAAARDGIRLLAGAGGVSLRAFQPKDWQWLATLTDPRALLALRRHGLFGAGGDGHRTMDAILAAHATEAGAAAAGATAADATEAEAADSDAAAGGSTHAVGSRISADGSTGVCGSTTRATCGATGACGPTGGVVSAVAPGQPSPAATQGPLVFPHMHSAREHLDRFFEAVLRDFQNEGASAPATLICEPCSV
jgi:hypothetical protein